MRILEYILFGAPFEDDQEGDSSRPSSSMSSSSSSRPHSASRFVSGRSQGGRADFMKGTSLPDNGERQTSAVLVASTIPHPPSAPPTQAQQHHQPTTSFERDSSLEEFPDNIPSSRQVVENVLSRRIGMSSPSTKRTFEDIQRERYEKLVTQLRKVDSKIMSEDRTPKHDSSFSSYLLDSNHLAPGRSLRSVSKFPGQNSSEFVFPPLILVVGRVGMIWKIF